MSKILGVDHICTSCKDIKFTSEKFNKTQYRTIFLEYGLQSTKEKKPYLQKFTVDHDAAFLKSKNGLSIEVIDHNSELIKTMGPYKILFKHEQSFSNEFFFDNDPIKKIIEEAFGFPIFLDNISEFNIPFYSHEEPSHEGLSSVIIECKNLSNCIRFWENAIGFKIKTKSQGKTPWCLLEFVGIVSSMTIKLLLVETNTPKEKSYLDYSGWTCLSFMVKGMDSALKQVQKFGATDIGTPYKMEIGGNTLRLSFFRGPEGELIEFLELYNN